jgi:hypothetical protein
MAMRTESKAWRTVLHLLVPAAAIVAALVIWQAGALDRSPSAGPVVVGQEPGSAVVANQGAAVSIAQGGDGLRIEPGLNAGPTARASLERAPDADELAEATALQLAVDEERANDR